MSTTEAGAELDLCPDRTDTDDVQVLAPRAVPLGGPRAMTVRRTLPHRNRSFVGAWCFVDHYGPDDVSATGGMDVPPHPHAGLQTVSWLFDGEIEHRDSHAVHAMVRPGAVNLMTGGNGIAHSEVSTPATTTLHGVQLWVVLPADDSAGARDFQHAQASLVDLAPGVTGMVFIGELAGHTSPITTFTRLLGAEIRLAAGADWTFPVPAAHEHAVLVDRGTVRFCGTDLTHGRLGVVDAGRRQLTLATDVPARVVLLGGAPFDEEVVMWWNFIGRSHDEIVEMREQWQRESDRFGAVTGYTGGTVRLPAPALPGTRLRSRGRTGRRGPT